MKFRRGMFIYEKSDWVLGEEAEIVQRESFRPWSGYIFPQKAVVVKVTDDYVEVEVSGYRNYSSHVMYTYRTKVRTELGVVISSFSNEIEIHPKNLFNVREKLYREWLDLKSEVVTSCKNVSMQGLSKIMEIIKDDMNNVHSIE